MRSLFFIISVLVISAVRSFTFVSRSIIIKVADKKLKMSSVTDDQILRRLDKWACVKNCGACCKLGPMESRPDLKEYLTKDELATYVSMIGEDDWCVNYDKEKRMCGIYETRPGFCVVDPRKFKTMFGVEQEDLNDFCKFCCTEQIADVYGEDSEEMIRFEDVIDGLETEVAM